MPRLIVGEGRQAERVDRLLAEECPGISRSTIQRWISEGRVLVDGRPCRAKDKVRAGAEILFEPAAPQPSAASPDPSIELDVVYEDEQLIVIDKPAGLVVHPGRGNWTGTLVNGLLARPGFERVPSDERDPAGPLRPGIVHRIDKDTSGLLVVAKTAIAREALKRQFAEHTIDRAYLALTLGTPAAGRIHTLHGRHPHHRLKFTSRVDDGRTAVTHIEVLESFGKRAAFVRARLETGRTHQIRVHLAEQRGTPIIADTLYGRAAEGILPVGHSMHRQALHAAVLGFEHPRTLRHLSFESPLPSDMQRALDELRRCGA